jgi:hypothetical protein
VKLSYISHILCAIVAVMDVAVLSQAAFADTLPIIQLLPAETQSVFQVSDLPKFVEKWNATQYGKMGNDEKLKPFWEAQRDAIQKRFADAGWQLNLKADELLKISTGQAGIAWVAQPQNARLPYAVCLVMDIAGKQAEAEEFLKKVDQELKAKKATSKDSQVAGTAVREYSLQPKPGETIIRTSFYSLTDTQLYATDDLSLLSALLNANKNGGHETPLAKDDNFTKSMGQLGEQYNEFDLQYFFRPIGFAKALRAISGRPAASQTDLLKVLENQGFNKLAAVAGKIKLLTDSAEIQHEGFVLTEKPLPDTVQILDFPNTAKSELPGWIDESVSSVTSFAWNAKDAFWKVRALVDEVAGAEGTFDSVIESIKDDPQGPRIDIRSQVLPYMTNQVFVVTNTVTPITVDSRRALIAIEVDDPTDQLKQVLDRAMQNEPGATPEDHNGHRLWNVSRGDEEIEIEVDDFGDFGAAPAPAAADANPPPLLDQWAIAKFGNFLFFASHPETIKTVMDNTEQKSELLQQTDLAPLTEQLKLIDSKLAAWRLMRIEKSFEMQYELFRRGELSDAQTIAGALLDRLLRPRIEVKKEEQPVQGNLLPAFAEVQKYLLPIGHSFETTDSGWKIQTVVPK